MLSTRMYNGHLLIDSFETIPTSTSLTSSEERTTCFTSFNTRTQQNDVRTGVNEKHFHRSHDSSFSLTLSDTSPLQTVEQFTLPHTVRHIPLYGGHTFFLTYLHTYIQQPPDAQTFTHSTADADAKRGERTGHGKNSKSQTEIETLTQCQTHGHNLCERYNTGGDVQYVHMYNTGDELGTIMDNGMTSHVYD
ncbi:hypothetical protein DTO217A2_539 [Paecilomyces variotii]|nr:hypothetical protein DTO217A2_539 [Paecilomyces variotii]